MKYKDALGDARVLALDTLVKVAENYDKTPRDSVQAAKYILDEAVRNNIDVEVSDLARVMGMTEERARKLLGDN